MFTKLNPKCAGKSGLVKETLEQWKNQFDAGLMDAISQPTDGKSSWLANLPENPCKRCGVPAIFELCSKCDKLLTSREDLIELSNELISINEEIEELNKRKNSVYKELKQTAEWLEKNDKEFDPACLAESKANT